MELINRVYSLQTKWAETLDHTDPTFANIEYVHDSQCDDVVLFSYDLDEFNCLTLYIICNRLDITNSEIPLENIPISLDLVHSFYGSQTRKENITRRDVEDILMSYGFIYEIEDIEIPQKKIILENVSTVNKEQEEDMCPVCYETYDTFYILNTCKHKFCFDCINTWINHSDSCPMCRTTL